MIVLPTKFTLLEIVLGGTVTTTQPHFVVNYELINPTGMTTVASYAGTTNNTTDVTLLAAPTILGERRIVKSIVVHNADSANATVTVQYDNGSAEYTIMKVTLATLETLVYESGSGWQVLTAAGALK